MNNAPLYDALNNYCKENIYPMHMPGHKQGRLFEISNLTKIDLTEVEGVDNLHNPCDVIKQAQNLAAKTFGADKTFFLINGSTAGIMASIASVCNPNDGLLVARNCHRSIYDAIITIGIKPYYIQPEIINEYGLIGGINPIKIEKIIKRHNDIKAIIITSPTYEGFTSDITSIAKIAHKYNKILIVDEAHGAHFAFHKYFPKTALDCGADIVIQSTHKTLPAFTQSAMLHIKGNRIDFRTIQSRLALYETSSPSYILMAGLDYCRYQLDLNKNIWFNKYTNLLQEIRNQLKGLINLKLVDNELLNTNHIYDIDYSKLVFYCGCTDKFGTEIDSILREKYKMQLELSCPNYFLGMTTIADSKKGLEKFVQSIYSIDKSLKKCLKKSDKYDIIKVNNMVLKPRDAYFTSKISVPLDESIGHICGDFIIPYPPGIPILVPGEEITKDIIDLLINFNKAHGQIIGLQNNFKSINILGE